MRKLTVAIVFLLITSLWSQACWAKEPATPELKLQGAIDLALKNDNSIEKSSLNIEKAKEQRENASDSVTYSPGDVQNAAADTAWYGLLSADLSWMMSKKTYAADEDSLVLSVCEKYWNVQESIEDLKAKEVAAAAAELTFRRVQTMVKLGMTPPDYASASPEGVLAGAGAKYNTAKSDLEKAKNKLNTDYETLNQMIGLWPEDRPVLVEEVGFEPLKEVVLEYEVQRVLEKSPKVWQAEESINLAKFASQKMWASGQYTPYEVRKIEKEQAELDAASAKEAVALATRSLYYTVRNLEAAMPVAEKGVAGAEESLRVAKLTYDLGMITREDLLKAESALEDAKKGLLELKANHAYAKLAFQKPWAVSAGGGA
ncbi:MAG: hypothetical protein JL50_11205 [Peptococcaceae bacterium BICA1-7]|nr:MAG: hypothetical protein JL50_11205 [Peptococcaceae bacterium BICA1-7]